MKVMLYKLPFSYFGKEMMVSVIVFLPLQWNGMLWDCSSISIRNRFVCVSKNMRFLPKASF